MYQNMPFMYPVNNELLNNNSNEFDRINNKLERLEKNIRILENRINVLENKNNFHKDDINADNPRDMYII